MDKEKKTNKKGKTKKEESIWIIVWSDLIGNEPRTTPLQLRAAIALSACRE